LFLINRTWKNEEFELLFGKIRQLVTKLWLPEGCGKCAFFGVRCTFWAFYQFAIFGYPYLKKLLREASDSLRSCYMYIVIDISHLSDTCKGYFQKYRGPKYRIYAIGKNQTWGQIVPGAIFGAPYLEKI
jgi:hypothetical protein